MKGIELYASREPGHRRTWTVAAILLVLVFITVGQLLGLAPAMITGFVDLNGPMNAWDELTYILFATFGCGAVLVFLWIRFFERRPLTTVGFNAEGLKRFGRGYAIGLAFLLAAVGIIWALGGYSIEAAGAFQTAALGAALAPIVVLLLGFIVQGSTEEVFFRGWLMQLVASRHGLWLAIGINSLLFGLMHGANIPPSKELFTGLLNIVLFGVFISLYAAREGSLWGVCGWHASWNWLLGLGFGLEVSGQVVDATPLIVDLTTRAEAPWWITGAAFGPEGSVVVTGLLLIGSVVLLLRARTRDHGVVGEPAKAMTFDN